MSQRATHFKETRTQRSFETVEDYTELIADLIDTKGKARICDISREMGISHVSVLKTIKRLIRDGYLIKESQQSIELTDEGKKMAAFAKRKHRVLSEFLSQLGVPEAILATDVEGIEHYISETTLKAIETHMKNCVLCEKETKFME